MTGAIRILHLIQHSDNLQAEANISGSSFGSPSHFANERSYFVHMAFASWSSMHRSLKYGGQKVSQSY